MICDNSFLQFSTYSQIKTGSVSSKKDGKSDDV